MTIFLVFVVLVQAGVIWRMSCALRKEAARRAEVEAKVENLELRQLLWRDREVLNQLEIDFLKDTQKLMTDQNEELRAIVAQWENGVADVVEGKPIQ